MSMIEVTVPIYDDESLDYVEIIQRIPEMGESIPVAYVSLYDDSEERVTYTVNQIDDIISALQEARNKWLARGGRP